MDLVTKKRLLLFAGSGNPELSQEIATNLKLPLGDIKLSRFANGELYCRYGESVRGADVFLLQSYCDPINDRIMEQLIMIDAAKRASAKRITVVAPFYGYSRQDRKAEGREPITARLVADMLTVAGADRVVTVDLHGKPADISIHELELASFVDAVQHLILPALALYGAVRVIELPGSDHTAADGSAASSQSRVSRA